MVLPPVAPKEPPPPPCCNVACGALAATTSTDAEAAGLNMCSRCARLVRGAAGGEVASTPESAKALFGGLVKAYHAQLTRGCGKSGCTNPACLSSVPAGSAPMDATAAAAPAVELAKRGLAAGANRAVYLCVGVQRCPPQALDTPCTGVTAVDTWRAGLVATPSPAAAKAPTRPNQPRRGAKRRVAGEFFEG